MSSAADYDFLARTKRSTWELIVLPVVRLYAPHSALCMMIPFSGEFKSMSMSRGFEFFTFLFFCRSFKFPELGRCLNLNMR